MTEQILFHNDRAVQVPWVMYPNRYGTWVNPEGRLYHYNQGVDHDQDQHIENGPWLLINEADISRLRDTYYKPFKAAARQRDQLEQGLRDLLEGGH